MDPFYLSGEQKQFLLQYIRNKRYEEKLSLFLLAGILLFLLPMFIIPGYLFLLFQKLYARMDGIDADFTSDSMQVLMTLAGTLAIIVGSAVGIYKIYKKHFGRSSDTGCLKEDAYQLHSGTFSGKSEDEGHYPYFLYDAEGQEYICTQFKDWKRACAGMPILFVTLENGSRYALLLPEEKTDN